MHFSVFYD
jgi:hypothetical protein